MSLNQNPDGKRNTGVHILLACGTIAISHPMADKNEGETVNKTCDHGLVGLWMVTHEGMRAVKWGGLLLTRRDRH